LQLSKPAARGTSSTKHTQPRAVPSTPPAEDLVRQEEVTDKRKHRGRPRTEK